VRKFFHRFLRVITFPFRLLWWLIRLPSRGFRKVDAFLFTEPIERPLGEALADTFQRPAGLLEYIDDLHKHLSRKLIGLMICVAILFVFTQKLVDFLAKPIGGLSALKAIDVTESIGVFMRAALFGGVTLASSNIAFELWLFAAPGLRPRSHVLGLVSILLVLVFFTGGMVFTYFILLPPALQFLLNFMGIQVIPRPSSFISFVTGILFWIGVTFEFPLLIYVLTLMGIVQPKSLLRHWGIAIVVTAVIAVAITPTTYPVNMSLVMGSMILLYFTSIGLGYLALVDRKKRALETQ
jgi:sec-independent protein translocase protein TatC